MRLGAVVAIMLLAAMPGAASASDFKVQRGTALLPNPSFEVTLSAGIDYVAPSGPAFVRIINTRLSGTGRSVDGGKQDPDRWMVWLSDASNLTTSFKISRDSSLDDNSVAWELIEYTGETFGVDEFSVRSIGTHVFSTDELGRVSAVVPNVVDDSDVVVIITGQAAASSTDDEVNQGMITAEWDGLQDQAVFQRGALGSDANFSFAVVEFTGTNWTVERVSHTYSTAGIVETETISLLQDIDLGFLHVQQRAQGTSVDQQGAEVWLSDASTVSFLLESSAATASGITSVAWVIENSGNSFRPLRVEHYSGSRASGFAEQDVWTNPVFAVVSIGQASVMGETGRSEGTGQAGDDFPRGSISLELSGVDQVTLTQSDSGAEQNYRFSVVEWPDSQPESVPALTTWGFAVAALVLLCAAMLHLWVSRQYERG